MHRESHESNYPVEPIPADDLKLDEAAAAEFKAKAVALAAQYRTELLPPA